MNDKALRTVYYYGHQLSDKGIYHISFMCDCPKLKVKTEISDFHHRFLLLLFIIVSLRK